MLTVITGEDRVGAEKAVRAGLGEGYEVFEGESLSVTDLPSIFQGTSLFAGMNGEKRRILLKNVTENAEVWGKITDYLDTEHEVVIWETKIDKRSAGYKKMKAAKVKMLDFPMQQPPEIKNVFNIFDTALRDGARAVRMVEEIELRQDPYMFFGLMVTQALKKFSVRQGAREREMLKVLAKLDMEMKTTGVEPWDLVKASLLQLEQIGK